MVFNISGPEGSERFQIIEDICPFEGVMFGKHREFKWQPGTCAYIEQSEWYVKNLDTSNL